jgi:hypothetical protein
VFHRFGLLPVFAIIATLALTACGSDKIEVERTSVLGTLAQPNFVLIQATGQERARDYGKYADQIASAMSAYGFKKVDDAKNARYALMFSYDGDGLERASEDRHRTINEKKKKDDKVERTMSIILYDLTRPRMVDETVFGGYAQCAVDSARRDPTVIPLMIDAIMKDFPGSGRETYTASLPSFK